MTVPATTLADVFAQHQHERPDAPLLLAPETGRQHTYGALGADVAALDALLTAQGIGAGAHVGFLLPNGLATSALFLATMIAGRVTVPLNLLSQAPQLAYVLAHSEVRCVFVSGEQAATLAAAVALLPTTGGATSGIAVVNIDVGEPLASQLPPLTGTAKTAAPQANDPALLMYTSGTTGKPKGALLT
ncbi:MAG TPA: class I adenylate-forming enzyme family protein, partial [Casimicrobium huifangae]|nr:class I adenylate-forming enzyme family protein [Casimicrobium huifangae]